MVVSFVLRAKLATEDCSQGGKGCQCNGGDLDRDKRLENKDFPAKRGLAIILCF